MRRRRRGLFWTAVLVALVLLVGGVLLGYRGYEQTTGPEGAVRGYFAALMRGDAASALALGPVPDGPHALLTDAALAEQHHVAALTDFAVRKVDQHGATGRVAVRYRLDFPGDPQQVDSTVPVREVDGAWRLARSAIATQLSLTEAGQRASVLGTAVSDGTVLVFPGAVPVRLDTPYLQLAPADAAVGFDSGATTRVTVAVSAAGRRRARSLVTSALRACLSGHGVPACPQPDGSYVPGSLRGTLTPADPDLTVTVGQSDVGELDVSGNVAARASYRRLDFRNRAIAGQGRVVLPLHARSYAVAPLTFVWTRSP